MGAMGEAVVLMAIVWSAMFCLFLAVITLERIWSFGRKALRDMRRRAWREEQNGRMLRFFPPRRKAQDWDAYLYKRREAEDVDEEEGL